MNSATHSHALAADVVLPEAPSTEVAATLATLAAGSRSFSFAARFLPAARREDAALLYAFCRYVDDLADEADDEHAARAALDALAEELRGEAAPRPLAEAVLALFARRDIPVAPALHLIEGVRSDLGHVALDSDAELVRYGYRVAGTVGLMMCGVLGVRDPKAWPYAVDLGVAMQITNIVRDVAEDAARGRVYVPRTRLTAVGVQGDAATLHAHAEAVRSVVADLVDLAERYYRSADQGLRFIPLGARAAILVASRVYRAIGLRLRRNGADPFRGRTVVPWFEKVYWAAVALAQLPFTASWRRPHRAMLHRALVGLPGASPDAGGGTRP